MSEFVPPATERRDALPDLNIYLPEGEFDIRVRKLIKNVLFEGQIDYKFVDGDISTFLRYKYYARSFTYRIGVFDTVEFASIESGSRDFDRVRGGLVLFEYPVHYNSRYLFLTQIDGLSFGDIDDPDNNRDNAFLKLAYQYGTPFDDRLNAIAGETRGRITPVLTAYREIGPQGLSWVAALTQGLEGPGDYDYTKLETEALKRFDVGRGYFIFSRLHLGSVLRKNRVPGKEDQPEVFRYNVPNYEYFRIGGRSALKGVDDKIRGSDEIHLSNEIFVPIFRERSHRTWRLEWNDLYGIGYLGGGAVGFGKRVFTGVEDYIYDAGIGFEAGLTVRDYDVFLTMVYAQTIRAPEHLDGNEIRFSIRTSR